ISDPATDVIRELLEELGPLVLAASPYLDLNWDPAWKDNDVDGSITVHGVSPSVDDLRVACLVFEELDEPSHERVLPGAVELTHDPHARNVMNAFEPGTAVALQLFEDCSCVLDPCRRCETEFVMHAIGGVSQDFPVRREQAAQLREVVRV